MLKTTNSNEKSFSVYLALTTRISLIPYPRIPQNATLFYKQPTYAMKNEMKEKNTTSFYKLYKFYLP